MRFSILTTLVLAAGLAACEPSAETTTTSSNKSQNTQVDDTDIGEVLADVNGMKVGSKAFEAAATRKVPKNGKELSTEEKQEVLKRLVDEKLLYQAALEKGLDRDPKVQKVMVNSLLREAVYANVKNSDFTDEDLQKYFDEHIDEFVVPEKVQIKRILIKVSDDRSDSDAKKEATRLQGELKKDPSQFKALASAHSEDPYKRRGGDVGFVPKSGKPGLDQAIVDK
ncbi:MAG: peptidylprolyl isomerase, partial [Myxococcota bacterium]